MKKHLFTGFIALMMCSTALNAQTWDISATSADHVTATLTDVSTSWGTSYTLTISGTGAMKDFASYSSVPWYSYAPYINNTISLQIAQGITRLGDWAFYDCYISSVTIPSSVTSIGSGVFAQCPYLTAINVDTSNPNFSFDGGSLFDKNKTTLICNLAGSGASYVIPGSVTAIGDYAFYQRYGLDSVTIPNSVTSIGDYAFYQCQYLTSATIGNSVTTIGNYAFYGCILTSVTFPNSLISIGDYAFANNYLMSITLSDPLTSLGDYAFAYCWYLHHVKLPKSLIHIGGHLFDFSSYDSGPLQTIEVAWDTPPAVPSDEFTGDMGSLVKFCTLIVPPGTAALYKAANGWKDFGVITDVNPPNTPDPPMSVLQTSVWAPSVTIDYQGKGLISYSLPTYYNGDTLVNPFPVGIAFIVNSGPVNVRYSMYTYKPTFSQSGKRNYLQGKSEAGPGPTDPPIRTMSDVNADLDKIYEFPVVTETAATGTAIGKRYFDWDGYTDPKFAGVKLPVNDVVWIIAQNADNGDFLGAAYTSMGYSGGSVVGSFTAGEKTISAELVVAYDDTKPIKKLTAYIMTESCGWGATPYSAINGGAEATLLNINSRLPGDVVAYTELTNPTVDADDPHIKTFEWNDIKGLDGKPWIHGPNRSLLYGDPQAYIIGFMADTDMPTFTGINVNIGSSTVVDVPSPTNPDAGINNAEIQNLTLYPNPVKDELRITDYELGNDGSYGVFSISGQMLMQGRLSGETTIVNVSSLAQGEYLVKVYTAQGVAVRKVIKN